jgi:hypothetical protein
LGETGGYKTIPEPTPVGLKTHGSRRVGLTQLVRFVVVKLTHTDSNSRFDMCVAFTTNYSFSGSRRSDRQRDTLGDRLRKSQDQIMRACVHRGE